ncbi:MAG: hypothetical protein KGZ72_04425, partial [Roseovarius sp.]|nr:hypothetical protein [Roseovarius sp.]
MRKIITAATLGLTALTSPVMAEDAKQMVTILTSAEPQTQLMGMVLTMQTMQAGASSYVLLCGPAGDLALKDAPAS